MISFELVSVFTRLQVPATRAAGSGELADLVGAEEVWVFGRDQEIGVFLPAPGLPQTLRKGRLWHALLEQCPRGGCVTGSAPSKDGRSLTDASVMQDDLGQVLLVFLGGKPDPDQQQAIAALLPLLGAKLVVERAVLVADGHAAAARAASRRAADLNAALDANRRELQRAYERVERELLCRREAENRLREADRRKDDFLAMLAHELRNPLAPISSAAQILQLPSVPAERARQAGQVIDRQLKHLSNLLDDLLDVSRVTRGRVTLEKEVLDIRALVLDAIEQARPMMTLRQHEFVSEVPEEQAIVRGDRTRLVQIITNLLNNACKYTPVKGHVSLRLSITDHEVRLVVSDSGVGIDAQFLPHVFELFSQGERSPDRSQGGLGLGLALVKSLVELHGGRVGAYSAGAGHGSEFSVFLPRVRETVSARQSEWAGVPAQGEGLRLMIVDDNLDAAQTLATVLDAVGHKVRVVEDARRALILSREEAPQVLLLDIGLPEMDGYELARQLRRLPQTADAVLIALTGYGQPGDQERAKRAGFNYHLTKPADTQYLIRLLSEIASA